jgi:hypothetical protein
MRAKSWVPILCASGACGAEGGGDDLDGGDEEGGRGECFELDGEIGPVGKLDQKRRKKWVTQNKFCVTF